MRPSIFIRCHAAASRFALSLALFVPVVTAVAASPGPVPGSLREQYPPASIDSVERADAALAATAGARGRVDSEFKAAARKCTSSILVNACLDRERELQRARTAEINEVELAANRYKRRDRADRLEADRAAREAERASKAKADGEQRARSRESFDAHQAQGKRNADDKVRTDTARASPTRKSTIRKPPPPPNDGPQRAKNAVDHAAKVREAETHKAEIDRRVATKTADRQRRAEEKAAKEAKTAAAALQPKP